MITQVNGFYIRDKHPCKRKIGVQKINAEKIFVFCYNPKTGKHEGKWCNKKDLLGTDFKNIDTMIKNANKRVREKLVNKRQDNSAFYASQFWVN